MTEIRASSGGVEQSLAAPVLELGRVTAGYGGAIALYEVSMLVPTSGVIALLGPNGAGKTTLLRTAAGLLQPKSGRVRVNGTDVTSDQPHLRVRRGLCLVPDRRGVHAGLTVNDNLRLLTPPWMDETKARERIAEVFPVLRERLNQIAGTLSGGQQQMLALSRAFLWTPSVVLLDEMSTGLAPIVVDEIFRTLRHLVASGVAVLLVEQYVERALNFADRVVLLNKGRIAFEGATSEVTEDLLQHGYLEGFDAL